MRTWLRRAHTDSASPDIDLTEEHPVDTEEPSMNIDEENSPEAIDTSVREGAVLAVGSVRRLRVHVTSGEVDVIGRDEAGALVEVHEVAGGTLPVRLADGLLQIGADPLFGQGAKAAVTVTVQRDAEVEIDVTSAVVLVSGTKNGLIVRTVSGDVVCNATAGPARLEGVSAELALREHEGTLDITTVSGPATASGAITRFVCTGVSGDVFLDLDTPDQVTVRTVSGEVAVRLGHERPAEYAVSSVSGTLHLDGIVIGRLRGVHHGTWAGPGDNPTRVRVDTSSGTVRIVHTDER
jgi:hypothetical protein